MNTPESVVAFRDNAGRLHDTFESAEKANKSMAFQHKLKKLEGLAYRSTSYHVRNNCNNVADWAFTNRKELIPMLEAFDG